MRRDSTPLPDWSTRSGAETKPSAEALEHAFCWPHPPFAAYPAAQPQTDPLECRITGTDGKSQIARLIMLAAQDRTLHVQLPPARTTTALPLSQVRQLLLLPAVAPERQAKGDPHSQLLEARPTSRYRVEMAQGEPLMGETIGHVELDVGLFLFPPVDRDGSVRRVFVPRGAYTSYEAGTRIGELLVEQKAARAEDIDRAAAEQAALRERKIGDILLSRQVVTPEALLEALERQANMPMIRIGEALTALGLVSQAQLQDALRQQAADRSVPLGELLVRMGCITRHDLQTALARKMGYPLVDLNTFPAEPDAVRKLPIAAARRLRAVPLLVRSGKLIVAIEDPSARAALEEIEFISQLKVVPALTYVGSVELTLASVYERLGGDAWADRRGPATVPDGFDFRLDQAEKLVETLEQEHDARADDEKPIEQSDNSLVRLVNTMIIEAHNQGVSDIHVETHPGREKVRIRFRKDGQLKPYLDLPHTYRSAIIGRIKVMCDLDISERRKPQDGKINFSKFAPGHRLELRVATIPTSQGLEDVVMRILASARPIAIDKLGLSLENLAGLKDAVQRPYGLVLCVGPTGSGKTTTLHSALGFINVPERKIWTAEDPIEITQPGLRQVQVNPKIDWTFEKALRAFLRADPDVIMVGEIRDQDTAEVAIEASLTGHLVLSTLHTNSAAETITRLLDMGMDPFNFGDSLLAVLAQRLVRRLCSHCLVSTPLADAQRDELLEDYLAVYDDDARPPEDEVLASWMERFGHDGKLMYHGSRGCRACDNMGFKGRVGIHELLSVTRALRRVIQSGGRIDQVLRVALAEGMHTLRQDGIEKVLAGFSTIEEVRATSNV